jgi:hypothetical protein
VWDWVHCKKGYGFSVPSQGEFVWGHPGWGQEKREFMNTFIPGILGFKLFELTD